MALDIIRVTLDRMRANDHMAIADLQRTNYILRQLDRTNLISSRWRTRTSHPPDSAERLHQDTAILPELKEMPRCSK